MERLFRIILAVALIVPAAVLSSPSWAQAPRYSGVTPEGGEPPSPKTPPPGFNFITWPGFRASEAGSEIFLQLTGPVNYKVRKKGARLYVTIDKVMVHLKNSLRTVITQHFRNTPVSRFRLRRLRKNRIRLEVSLRKKTAHNVSVKSAGGYHYLIVYFPPR